MHNETKKAQEVITNPITGEVIRVLESTPDLFRFEFVLLPHGTVAGPHQHPSSQQTIAARSGTLHCSVEGTHHVLEPGQAVLVEGGQTHTQWKSRRHRGVGHRGIPPRRPDARLLPRAVRDGAGRTDQQERVPSPLLASALFAEFSDSVRVGRHLDWMLLTALRPLARLAGSHRVVLAYLRGNGQPAEAPARAARLAA